MKKQTKIEFWRDQVESQVQWINRCGGSLAGYVARYGAADDPNKYGEGGPAIYEADNNYLEELTQKLNKAIRRKGSKPSFESTVIHCCAGIGYGNSPDLKAFPKK